ncbi:MAG: AAA family ATPase [bacterium]
MSSWSRPEWIGDIERKAALDRFLERDGDDTDAKRDAANIGQTLPEIPTTAQRPAGGTFPGIRASDLKAMEFPPIKYVVRGYIVEGLTILAGRPKLGKSWLCYYIANGVASERFVLGDIECVQGDVLYLALEDNPRRLQGRMRKLMPLDDWPAAVTSALKPLITSITR